MCVDRYIVRRYKGNSRSGTALSVREEPGSSSILTFSLGDAAGPRRSKVTPDIRGKYLSSELARSFPMEHWGKISKLDDQPSREWSWFMWPLFRPSSLSNPIINSLALPLLLRPGSPLLGLSPNRLISSFCGILSHIVGKPLDYLDHWVGACLHNAVLAVSLLWKL